METTTTRPRNSPPAPPPKPKGKSPYNNGSDHQQTSYEEHANNNVENFYSSNHTNGNGNSNSINNNHYYSSQPPRNEQVVMTPRGKTSNSTVILIERKLVEEVSDRVHVAGGDHQGIIINKDVVKGELWWLIKRSFHSSNLSSLQIKSQPKSHRIWRLNSAYFSSAPRPISTHKSREPSASGSAIGSQTANERRKLHKTFSASSSARRNFREVWFSLYMLRNFTNNLLFTSPDYVGFIKKIMKLMQKGYNEIQSIEIELRILEQTSAPPSRPREYLNTVEGAPETDVAMVRIKRVRFIDEVWVIDWWWRFMHHS